MTTHDPKLEKILGAATDIFLTRGFGGATIDDISRAARISKTTLYSRFESKRELFQAVMERSCHSIAVKEPKLDSASATLEEGLRAAGMAALGRMANEDSLGVFKAAVFAGAEFPDIPKVFWSTAPAHLVDFVEGLLSANSDDFDLTPAQRKKASLYFINQIMGFFLFSTLLSQSKPPGAKTIKRELELTITEFLNRLKSGPEFP